MKGIACDGSWQHRSGSLQDGAVICDGTIQIVDGVGGSSMLPPLTYSEANTILAAVLGLWALVFGLRQIRRLF